MILIAFDVDGTLDTSAGPVVWTKVKRLAATMPQVQIGIVSPSGARPQDDTPAYLSFGGAIRRDNLREFADAFPTALLHIYVSDNPGDEDNAHPEGFMLVKPEEFARGLE
jgi:hypothetical protein